MSKSPAHWYEKTLRSCVSLHLPPRLQTFVLVNRMPWTTKSAVQAFQVPRGLCQTGLTPPTRPKAQKTTRWKFESEAEGQDLHRTKALHRITVFVLESYFAGERCLKCMYAKKPQFEYAVHDATGRSHFRRVVQKGAKAGTETGCKHGACYDAGILPLLVVLNGHLPEILFFSLKVKNRRCHRTSSTKVGSPALDQSLESAKMLRLLKPRQQRRLGGPNGLQIFHPTGC